MSYRWGGGMIEMYNIHPWKYLLCLVFAIYDVRFPDFSLTNHHFQNLALIDCSRFIRTFDQLLSPCLLFHTSVTWFSWDEAPVWREASDVWRVLHLLRLQRVHLRVLLEALERTGRLVNCLLLPRISFETLRQIYFFIESLILWFINSFTHSFIYLFTYSLIHFLIHSFIHSFYQSISFMVLFITTTT